MQAGNIMSSKNWEALSKVGKNAALTENTNNNSASTKSKHLKAVPIHYFDMHKSLKNENKTSLDFSAYIIEAIREKLDRDIK